MVPYTKNDPKNEGSQQTSANGSETPNGNVAMQSWEKQVDKLSTRSCNNYRRLSSCAQCPSPTRKSLQPNPGFDFVIDGTHEGYNMT